MDSAQYKRLRGKITGYVSLPRYSKLFYHTSSAILMGVAFGAGFYFAVAGVIHLAHALSESTLVMPADTTFDAAGYDDGDGTIVVSGTEVRLGKADNWWDDDFKYKKVLSLKNLSAAALTATGSAQITVNTKELVDAGKLQADCDDLRVAHVATESAGLRTELPRAYQVAAGASACSDSTATIVTFPLQASVAAGGAGDGNYELYYGNEGAGSSSFGKALNGNFASSAFQLSYASAPSNLKNLNTATWEFWVKPSTISGEYYLLNKYYGAADGAEWAIKQFNSEIRIVASPNGIHYSRQEFTTSGYNLVANVWTHVAVTHTPGTGFSVYKNGRQINTFSYTSDIYHSNTGAFRFGMDSGGNQVFTGSVDDIRIWNIVRSESEIESNRFQELSGQESGLIGYWKLNEGSGSTALNSVSGGGNASVNSSLWTTSPISALGYSVGIDGAAQATLVCPFNGTTTCTTGQTPSTETGAVRYSGGKSAMSFDGVDDGVVSQAKVNIPNKTYTVEYWIYLSENQQNNNALITSQQLYPNLSYDTSNDSFRMVLSVSNRLSVHIFDGIWGEKLSATLSNGQWQHIAIIYAQGVAKMYLNGNLQSTNSVINDAVVNFDNYTAIGGSASTNVNKFRGQLDNFRISNTARYTSNFTPPTEPFTPDANTVLLYHFDENGDDPRNSGKAIDASGNGNHGTINGAKYVSGLVGVDKSATETGAVPSQSYASHQGVFIEEGTTNKITNPSFENDSVGWNSSSQELGDGRDGALALNLSTIAGTGTLAGTAGTQSITGAGTSFTTQVTVGEVLNIGSETYTVTAVSSNTALTVSEFLSDNFSGQSFTIDKYTTYTLDSDVKSNGRQYADAVNFNITANVAAGASQIPMGVTPSGLSVGDEILIINLRDPNNVDASLYGYKVQSTATTGTTSTLTDSTKNWTTNEFAGMTIAITSGTGQGQSRTVASNTSTVVTVSANWTTTPDATSQYKIMDPNGWTNNIDSIRVGQYETKHISAINGALVTVSTPLENGYDGTNFKIMVQRVPQYTDVTISDKVTLTISAYNDTLGRGGVLFFKATGGVTIVSTATITVTGKGYPGGSGSSSQAIGGMTYSGQGGNGGNASNLNGRSGLGGGGGGNYRGGVNGASAIGGGGGGGGSSVYPTFTSGGGGGGGFGTSGESGKSRSGSSLDGTNGNGILGGSGGNSSAVSDISGGAGGGGIYGNQELSRWLFGSGGGMSGTDGGPNGGRAGGQGGGAAIIFAQSIANNGSMLANGTSGTSSCCGMAGSGAGSGGLIYLRAPVLSVGSSTVSAIGGSGGISTSASPKNNGGNGGSGRVRLDYTTLTGTSNPAPGHVNSSYAPSTTPISASTVRSKFGSKSLLVNNSAGVTGATISAPINPGNTNKHTLSLYAYATGASISTNDLALFVNGSEVATTYEDVGGGWWRLKYADFTPIDGSTSYGFVVRAGKTIYVDGVQLEQKSYATTYADGSLGTGYSWSGTAHASTSVRSDANRIYRDGSANGSQGTFSVWVKPNWSPGSINHRTVIRVNNGTAPNYDANAFWLYYPSGYSDWKLQITDTNNSATTLSSSHTIIRDQWSLLTVTYVAGNIEFYVNGVLKSTATGKPMSFSNPYMMIGSYSIYGGLYHANSTLSDLRIFNAPLTAAQVADLYNQGLVTHTQGTEGDDRYQAEATYTSPTIDLQANGAWGITPWSATTTLNGGMITFATRSSADNTTWSDWAEVLGTSIASDPRRYLQWKATMAPAGSPLDGSPVVSGVTLAYVEDSTAPVNPDTTARGYSVAGAADPDLTSGNWHNYAHPKFAWDAAVDDAAVGQSASGVLGYHALFTTDADAIPVDETGDECYAFVQSGAEVYTVGTTNASCELTDGVYYLRLQSKDHSGNVADPVTLFTYKYDGSIPNAPSSVATSNVGYQATNSFTFFWPQAADNGPSGVAGYEYKTAAGTGSYSDWQYTTSTTVADIPAYQEGQNFFYVRTKDTAGNYSGSTSNDIQIAAFYFNESAPTAPRNISISPNTTSSTPAAANVFTVTWDKPESYSGEIAKYYYCVNCTPSATTMTEMTPAQIVNRTLTNVAIATQQGKNTLYIVAEDNNVNSQTGRGNRNFEAAASIDFYATTTAPGAPTALSVADSSDRDNSLWRLTLAWKAPSSGGTPTRYDIYRSADNTSFVLLGNTSSTAYTDADLTQSTKYYYKVLAVDNAGSSSLFSNTVTLSPEGRYSAPPSAGGIPSVSAGSTTATVSWTTGRKSFGTVQYGKTTTYGSAASDTVATPNHSIKITGLAPGTTYHYRVQSLDDSSLVGYDRDDAYSADYSFTTLNTPAISEVEVTDQSLSSVVISWKTASLATSSIEYGESTEYGESVEVSVTADESMHSARLSDLKDSTQYHFRVRGTTADGDDIFSEDNTFETITFPKVTAVVFNTDQATGATAAVLAWSTNVPTSSDVSYQPVSIDIEALRQSRSFSQLLVQGQKGYDVNVTELQKLSQTELAQLPVIANTPSKTQSSGVRTNTHLQRIEGLSDGSLYVFTLYGNDQYGNQAISNPIRYVTGKDTRPPGVKNLVIETPITGTGTDAKSQIIVSWETDEPAKGQILWGAGSGTEYPNASEKEGSYVTQHVLVIRDLAATSTYHLQIVSEDRAGNAFRSKDTVVVTPTAQEAAFDVIIKNLEDIFGFITL